MNEHALRIARDNLRRAMEIRGMTSFDLSEKIGRNRTYIDDFIRGRKRSISSSSARQTAVILNIAEKYVTGDEELPVKIEFNDTYEYWEKFSEYLTKKMIELDAEADPHVSDLVAKLARDIPGFQSALQTFMDSEGVRESVMYKVPYENQIRQISILKDSWSLPSSYIDSELNTSLEDILVLPVPDMSMARSGVNGILRGEYLIIDKSKVDVINGGIFALFAAGHILFRRVELISQAEPTRLLCKAANPEYSSFEVSLGTDVRVVGRAVAHLRRL